MNFKLMLRPSLGFILALALSSGGAVTALAAEPGSSATSYSYLEGQYGNSHHLDSEALTEAGIIDQSTADRITAYASKKHEQIHDRYNTDMSAMSPDERHAHYAGYEKDSSGGDSADELLSAGIITQEQADAIRSYLGK